jgi:hypothetical protein
VRAEVRLINFDFAVLEGRLALAFLGDALCESFAMSASNSAFLR